MIKHSANLFQFFTLVLLMVSMHPFDIYGQDKPVQFERISTSDGLSQNNVFSITQDQKGFIWIGTEDGLNRYDGYNFKIFKKIAGDTLSLSDTYIMTVLESVNGTLWVGTEFGGLNKFNSDTETFTSFQHNHTDPNSICSNFITSLHEDTIGNLWIGSRESGFDYFNITNRTFVHATNMLPAGFKFESNEIIFIHQDAKQRLWVGCPEKLYLFRIDYSSQSIPQLLPMKINNLTLTSPAISIEEDVKGNIWIGTVSDGLFIVDNESQSLQKYKLEKFFDTEKNYPVTAIESDKDKSLWLGIMNIGLLSLDLENGAYKIFRHDPKSGTSISNNMVISLFIDKTGVLWAGTSIAGINKYDPTVVKFKLYQADPNRPDQLIGNSTRGFYLDEHDKLWICSAGGGLNVLDRKTGKYLHYRYDPSNPHTISSNTLRCIYEDEDKALWIGTDRGLNKFDRNDEQFERFYIDRTDSDNPVNGLNYAILEIPGRPGYLWFGTNGGGLIRFNKKNHQIKSYTYDPESENSLNNRDNFVRTLFYSDSRPDELWLGTTHGINIFNLDTEKFRYYEYNPDDNESLSHNNIMHFYEDKQGIIWIGTYGGGLNRFDPSAEKFKRFTEQNSNLPNDAVYAILPDEQGNLWLSTNNGISKFNPQTEQFRNYTVDDGLQSEEFNGGSFYKSASGEMFFGGLKGFNSFFPDEVLDNPYPPELAITDFKVFNKSVKIGGESPLKRHISETDKIVLDYWQNDISFDFVALHFARPARNQYAFKLDNYDEDWRYSGNKQTATYTNLDPGEYVFRIKGSNNDGIWNEQGKSIQLVITPPWWKTNLAYVSYGLLIILGIFAADRFQRRRMLFKEQEKVKIALLEAENERKTKELEEARNLQLSMLPKELPKLPHLDIAVYMKTATEVGGDYYDFHVGMDGTLTVVIGDATGHGMKAGTMVTTAKSLFNSYAPNPDILFSFQEITRCIKQMNLGKMSMCMTMLKVDGNKMQLSSAGMPPSFIFRRDTRIVEEQLIQGMPLGTMDNFQYKIQDTTLSPGDTILLLTDGLPELQNEKGELYGYKRVRNLFEEVAENEPEDIISELKSAGSAWVNDHDPEDDVTFVVIKVK